MDENEIDSAIYDAFTKGHAEGRLAGLKEAAEMIEREAIEFGTIGDGLGDLLAEEATKAIRSRIEEIERG